jgi:hypothetical protein
MTIIDPPIRDNSDYYRYKLYQNTNSSKKNDSVIALYNEEIHVEELEAAAEIIPANVIEDDNLKQYSMKVSNTVIVIENIRILYLIKFVVGQNFSKKEVVYSINCCVARISWSFDQLNICKTKLFTNSTFQGLIIGCGNRFQQSPKFDNHSMHPIPLSMRLYHFMYSQWV